MQRPGLIARSLVIAGLFSVHAASAQSRIVQAGFIEELSIGDDEDADVEYLLGNPTHVRVDSAGNIYVAEEKQCVVKVFDRDGDFLRALGARGEGPGEFREISGMVLDEDGRVVVLDRFARRITTFSSAGPVLSTYPFDLDHRIHPTDIVYVANQGYAFPGAPVAKGAVESEHFLVSVFDSTFNKVRSRAVQATDLYDLENPFHLTLLESGFNLQINTGGPEELLVAPFLYNGKVYVYARHGGEWSGTVVRGYMPDRESHHVSQPTDAELRQMHAENSVSQVVNGTHGRFAIQSERHSFGTFRLNDGHLVHFVHSRLGNMEWRMYVEFFAPDLTFMGRVPLEKDAREDGKRGTGSTRLEVLELDENGRFYAIGHESGFPVLHKMRFQYSVE
jgi:hypothetical protein